MATPLQMIQDQYKRIPTFECIPGCTDCCGPVPMTVAEQTLITPLPFRHQDARCQYLVDGACSIYEHRPLLCRLFGTVDAPKLRCPHGKRPEKLLTAYQGGTIMRKYLQHPRGQDPLRETQWLPIAGDPSSNINNRQ